MSTPKRLVLVDGSAVFYRGYHAIPGLKNAAGEPTNALFGFASIMLRMLDDLKPTYTIMTWDKSSKTFRKELYPEYKAHRKPMPDDLREQIPGTKELTKALGLPWVELENFEADDIIGTLARKAEEADPDLEVVIVTGDMDELQLVSERTKVYTMKRGFSDTVIYDLAAMQQKYGLTPQQFIDLKALKGDASDNIPGVPGVGEKTAQNLIVQYGSLDGVYQNTAELKGKLKERIEENKELAYLSRKLSEIDCDAPVELDLKVAKVGNYDRAKLHELFRRYEFRSLMNKLPAEAQPVGEPSLFDVGSDDRPAPTITREHLKTAKYHTVVTAAALKDLATNLAKQPAIAFDTETTGVDSVACGLVGISISHQAGEAYYIPVAHKQGKQLSLKVIQQHLTPIFANPKIGKVGHNAKFDYEVLTRHGLTPTPISFDTMIAAFLLNPIGRSQSLTDLAYAEFGIDMIPITELIGTGRTQTGFADADIDTATTYAAEDADITWRLYEKLQPQLKQEGLSELAERTDWPLIEVLARMELTGIKLDSDFLTKLSKQFAKDIAELEKKIYAAAGEEFNIASPAQLSVVLFETLDLPKQGVKKGKTGFSTAASELDKLKDAHPIVPLIGEYRELAKLKSTYVDTLPLLADDNGRVHTSFNQTIAQTGRLSSTNPNLQNIPVRTEIGRQIRTAFIAPKGRKLVSADYSQIELRVAASLSGDKGMIATFKQGVDLHQQTAAELYEVPLDQVTKQQRYAAKTINFGVLYGMSPHGLSVATGMPRDEAQAFIDRYFAVRTKLADYIESVKQFGRKNGYTQTKLGRRRPCPDINSNVYVMRAAAERVAVNVPIQGTAADIYKLAMIALEPKLPKGADLLLQIHDELIVEADDSQAEAVAKLMQQTMAEVYDLGVPLAVDTSIGDNWGEL